MIWDELGLPKVTGASDLQDSAMFAGMLATFEWPQKIPLQLYVPSKGKYVRHPREYVYTFSRDQTIALFSGLRAEGLSNLVDPNYKTEGDIVAPDVRGHFRRCAGLVATGFQDLILWASIHFHIHFAKEHETNQLFCMMWTHPDIKFMRYFCQKFDWKKSIIDYYCGWRAEPEFAAHMIGKIEWKLIEAAANKREGLT